ncbi:anaerobic sulfatase maturase [Candidatus Poribacteria bacterium]|nr:anaerobic sulfatase maturase [Candidatus Poribacteria bacterium]
MKQQKPFHVMTKPIGAICNLDCEYCYYLEKEELYPETKSFRMEDSTLENYIRQYIETQSTLSEITFAWQGGEPTLMGIDFFRKAVELQDKYRRSGMTIRNSLQTNATIINDEWAIFFKENNFLIGISIDGPPKLHDHYRFDKKGDPSSADVIRGLRLFQKHEVDYNILCVVNNYNGDYPVQIYNYFKDLGAQFMQFIPIVEHFGDGSEVSPRSINPKQYGRFLCAVFDEWVKEDIGKIFIQIFDVSLEAWLGFKPSLCIFNETCGDAMAMEHNGDVYACDHYVTPEYLVGNIGETPIADIINLPFQRKFGEDKKDTLPPYCLDCEVRFVCNGGCPKNRFIDTPNGDPGLNYLCEGYKMFFNHIDAPMKLMAVALENGQTADSIIPIMQKQKTRNTRSRPKRRKGRSI